MKIKSIMSVSDYRGCYSIEIDGNEAFCVHDGEPEDNNIGRNFNDVLKITDLMELAYKAGKNGEELIIEHETQEEKD